MAMAMGLPKYNNALNDLEVTVINQRKSQIIIYKG